MFTNDFLASFPGAAYQVFADSPVSKVAPQNGSLLDITEQQLQSLNKLGAGIFFSPNAMQRGFRDKKHCLHINAYFVDMDTGTKAEQYKRIIQSPITPSYIVESKNGYHIYFLTEKDSASIEHFSRVQQALIEHYKGDQQCKDVSRVLRIPGFYHFKNPKDPFKVKVIEANSSVTYTEGDMVELFNIDFTEEKKAPDTYKRHAAPKTFWEYVGNIPPMKALQTLSGTKYVNHEQYEFPERPNGGYYIVVNGQMANAWIDEEGLIGSGAKGGPTIIQWLKYYGYDYGHIANIIRATMPKEIPQEVLEGEVVTVEQASTAMSVELKARPVEDIKTVQALADTFIVSHAESLYFCLDDQTVYRYDEEKKYHVGYNPMTVDKYINNYIIDTLGYNKSVTGTVRKEVYAQIKYRAPEIEFEDEAYISLKDGLLNLETLEMHEHTPDIFCTMHLPLTKQELEQAECPTYDAFVDSIMVYADDPYNTDPDLKEKYLQIMGYYLSPKQRPHAFIFFIGSQGRNGKGTAANLLKEIIGHEYCSALTLDKLSNSPHAASALVGKRLNICGEDESMYIKNDILKTLASDDAISVNPKFRDEFTYTPIAKYLLMSNANPKFSTIDNAMKRRIHIIPHNREFLEHELDWDLPDKLKAELPGIIWKFAQAYQRLVENNYVFHKSDQSNKALRDLEREVSATLDWFEENFEATDVELDDNFYASDDLYAWFKQWCDSTGRRQVARNRWAREINDNIVGIKGGRKRIDGKQYRGYYLVKKDE